MNKKVLSILLASLFVADVSAAVRPMGSISVGTERMSFKMDQMLTLIPPFQNRYVGQLNDRRGIGGLFLGFETELSKMLSLQLGGSYFGSGSRQVNGYISQMADEQFINLSYSYSIKSRRAFFEGKLLTTLATTVHPFITAGVGRAWNKAYNYVENSLSNETLPMVPGFSNRGIHSTASFYGIGIEKDLNSSFRLGVMYRRVGLGNVALGTTVAQDTDMTLNNPHLHGNEVLLQLSYLG